MSVTYVDLAESRTRYDNDSVRRRIMEVDGKKSFVKISQREHYFYIMCQQHASPDGETFTMISPSFNPFKKREFMMKQGEGNLNKLNVVNLQFLVSSKIHLEHR